MMPVTMMKYDIYIIAGVILMMWSSHSISAFQASSSYRFRISCCVRLEFSSLGNNFGDNNAGPIFPPLSSFNDGDDDDKDGTTTAAAATAAATVVGRSTEEEEKGQANTRFSAFAPDPNLDANDFRLQLRENMKANLERRRNEDPNRGNQIAKHYLDSL